MKKTRSKNPSPKRTPSTEAGLAFTVTDSEKFKPAPRRRRTSLLDDVAKKLIDEGKGKVVQIVVPPGRDVEQFRSYAYAGLKRCLTHFSGKAMSVAIKISADGKNLGVSLK